MSKHTRGPWVVASWGGYDYGSKMFSVPGICTNIYSKADAQLIAAAPDLLASLQGLLNALPSATTHPAIAAARAAVAKATGGTPR